MSGRVNRRGWIVMESIASDDNGMCVDFFEHPEGGFGYELFLADPEGQTAWIVVGHFGSTRFGTPVEAVEAAVSNVPFLTGERRPAAAVAAWIAHLGS